MVYEIGCTTFLDDAMPSRPKTAFEKLLAVLLVVWGPDFDGSSQILGKQISMFHYSLLFTRYLTNQSWFWAGNIHNFYKIIYIWWFNDLPPGNLAASYGLGNMFFLVLWIKLFLGQKFHIYVKLPEGNFGFWKKKSIALELELFGGFKPHTETGFSTLKCGAKPWKLNNGCFSRSSCNSTIESTTLSKKPKKHCQRWWC